MHIDRNNSNIKIGTDVNVDEKTFNEINRNNTYNKMVGFNKEVNKPEKLNKENNQYGCLRCMSDVFIATIKGSSVVIISLFLVMIITIVAFIIIFLTILKAHNDERVANEASIYV